MTSTCGVFDGPPPARDTYIADHGFRFNPAAWRRRLPQSAPWADWLDELPYAGRWPRITRGHLLWAGNVANGGQAEVPPLFRSGGYLAPVGVGVVLTDSG